MLLSSAKMIVVGVGNSALDVNRTLVRLCEALTLQLWTAVSRSVVAQFSYSSLEPKSLLSPEV